MAMLAWDRSNALWHHYGGTPSVVPCHAVYLIAIPIYTDFVDLDVKAMVARTAGDHHSRLRDLQGASSDPMWMMEVADTLEGGFRLLASSMRIGPEPFIYAHPTADQARVALSLAGRARRLYETDNRTDRDVVCIALNHEDTQHYVV